MGKMTTTKSKWFWHGFLCKNKSSSQDYQKSLPLCYGL
ncbi:hypothetical protein CWATWH0005_805 [Crocosphaera watsonii WH 0005]|uniref:Uncharacterized protein n=1 Tax=Crocosphaera watsonii WH 0005 TaxID=423472 RepID=T2ISG1_CROWT|nr:hypothetical protein CWATWH0005_805 [Crocosphaera watsonii WH 0005]